MIIGKSRIGIGRLGIASTGAEELAALANITILDRRSLWMQANMNIVGVHMLYTHANMDIDPYNHRQILANMSIIGRIPIQTLANMSISDREVRSVSTNLSIIAVRYHQTLAAMSILGYATKSTLAGMTISGDVDHSIFSNINIAEYGELFADASISISDSLDIYTSTNINISDLRACTMPASMTILDKHYWAIGPEGAVLDLSGKVADPKPDGFGIETARLVLPEGRRVSIKDKGIKGGEYMFHVYFNNDTERLAFQRIVNNDAENYVLHIGRSDRFYYVKKIATNPEKIKNARGPVQRVTCWMEDPCMYDSWDQGLLFGVSALPWEDAYKFNHGTAPAPFLFKIGGFHSGGLQLTHPSIKALNGSEESNLYIGPGLLSNEYVELTLDGWHKRYLRHTYADDYSTNNYWQYDVIQEGCVLANGQVSVPAGRWFYYKFQGHPLKDDIELIATISKSGSPQIQFSIDGANWQTAVDAEEIENGTKKYYLTGTEKLQTVYVRFYSPSGSSMTIQDVAFAFDRDISSQYDQLPVCPTQEYRKLRIEGSGSSRAKIQTSFRSRWHAQ